MRAKGNKALSAGVGYTVGNMLIKGINFLSIPLFSRLLSTEEFGVYNVFLSYDAILSVVVGLALHSSVRSASYEFKGKIDAYTASVSLIYLINLLVLLLIVALFGGLLSAWMGFERVVLYMLVLLSFGNAVLMLYNNRISLDYSYKQYLLVAMINSLGNIAVSLLLIFTAFRTQRDIGRIVGASVTVFALAIVLLALLYRKAKPRCCRQYWRFGLKYSLPIVPHGVSQVLLAQFDRIMIRSMVSDAAAGIYSLAANIKLILTVISDSVSTAWSTWFYEQMDKGDTGRIQKRATQLAALGVILTVGLMALSPELIWLLGGAAYDAGKYVAIPMVLDAFILFLYNLIVCGEYYKKKTVYIMLGTMLAAVLNVITNYFFIRRFGFIAAAYTTLFSYVCYWILHLVISRRLVRFFIVPVKWLPVFGAIVGVSAAADLLLIESTLWRWLLCAAVVIPMAVFLLRDFPARRAHKDNGAGKTEKEEEE